MKTTEKELIKKYIQNEYNDVQLNYIMVQNKFDKNKIYKLIELQKITEPFYAACKVLLGFIIFHYLFSIFCLFFEIFNY